MCFLNVTERADAGRDFVATEAVVVDNVLMGYWGYWR